MAGEESAELHLHTPGIGQQLARWTPRAAVRVARRGSCAAAKFGKARRRLQGAGSLPHERREAARHAACGQRGGRSVPVRFATGPRSSCSFQQQIRGEQRGGGRHLQWHLRAASIGCPGRSSQSTQMGPTLSSYAACTAARRVPCLEAWPAAVFALANILLKSFVEQKGALSTIKRCTGASHFACAHCLRLPRACQGPLPSAQTRSPSLLTVGLFFAGAGAVSGLELAACVLPV